MKNINRIIILLVAMLVSCMLMVGCGSKTHEETMLDIYEKGGYDKASEYISTVEDPSERIDLIYVLGAYRAGVSKEEFEKMMTEYEDDSLIYKKVEIVDDVITESSTGNKKLTITLKNNTGKTLSYVKADIFYLDDNGNVKDTEWTNKSGTFENGGEFIMEKYINLPNGATKYRVKVSEASVK